MTAIRVIFDGKNFVPQEPVSLPAQSEVTVLIDQGQSKSAAQIEQEIRDYYIAINGEDEEDKAWSDLIASQGSKVWDED